MLGQIKRFILDGVFRLSTGISLGPAGMLFYGVFFAAVALYIVPLLLSRTGVELDVEFFTAMAPFVLLGGFLKASTHPVFGEPLVYVLFAAVVYALLYGSKRFEAFTGITYHKPLLLSGLVLLGVGLARVDFLVNQALLASILAWSLIAAVLLKAFWPRLWSPGFVVPVASHLFDASTTVAVLSAGGREKNFFAAYFLDLFGPYTIFGLKALVVIPLTYYVYTRFEGDERNYYLFLVALLGIVAGVRNIVYPS
ncbi:MAG: DUF63 family protein [Candidatus Nanohaloarchaea archaeon]